MKKNISIILVFVLLMQIILPIQISNAANGSTLITTSGITITTKTTPEEITSKYGASPKLVTPSAFGGNMYTWYKGDYEEVIYLETDSEGTVIAAGAVSDDFTSDFYSAGDEVSGGGTVNRYQGTVAEQGFLTNYAKGVIVYNKDVLTTEKVNQYYNEYVLNEYHYDKYMAEQSVIMLNALLREDGADTRAEFSEELFDKVRKIGQTMSIEDYAEQNGKSMYYKQARTDFGSSVLYADLPNPLRPAASADNYYPTEDLKYAYLAYGVSQNEETGNYTSGIGGFYMSEKLFEETTEVSLTAEEQTKLENATEAYMESVEIFNQNGEDIYEEEPNYATLPLDAGKIKENKLQGAAEFLNAIRVGAGLDEISYSADLSESAQYKAVLTAYLTENGISNPTPHYPPRPAGVSDEYYNIAQKYMSGENLYSGDIITSIAQALHDGAGDPINAGHRYNLLNPNWTAFGIGYANGQSAHKLSGSASSNVDMVAWPSAGITPTEAWYGGGYWTFKLYSNKYSIQSNTTVEVKRLNDNKTWVFDDNVDSNSDFVRGSKILSFRNADLTGEDGLVYEITVKNLKNTEKNAVEDYTYRAVFKSLYSGVNSSYPTEVQLDKSEITGIKGAEAELKVTFQPETATEVTTKWSSSNPSVATVNQSGIVTFVGTGTTTITVETLNGKKDTCTVKGVSTVSGLKIEPAEYTLKEEQIQKLELIETSNIVINENDVKWTVSDPTVATINKGMLTILEDTAGSTITVTAEYGGKKVTCTVNVIQKRNTRPTFKLRADTLSTIEKGETNGITLLQEGENTNISSFELDINYNADNLKVAKIEPLIDNLKAEVNTPGKVHVTFDSNNQFIDINKNLLYITFEVITSLASDNQIDASDLIYYTLDKTTPTSGTVQYIARIKSYNEIQNVKISKTSHTFENLNEQITLTATLEPNENIKNDEIKWSTSDKSVARVDDNGKVTAVGYGTATITAESANGKKATCVVNLEKKEEPYTLGDINSDGVINTLDAILVLQYISHKTTLTDAQKLAADTSKDGIINTVDAIKILQYVSHKITEF